MVAPENPESWPCSQFPRISCFWPALSRLSKPKDCCAFIPPVTLKRTEYFWGILKYLPQRNPFEKMALIYVIINSCTILWQKFGFQPTHSRSEHLSSGYIQLADVIQKTKFGFLLENPVFRVMMTKALELAKVKSNVFVLTLLYMLDSSCVDKRQGHFLLLNSWTLLMQFYFAANQT